MKTVSIVTQKGGSGKTTLATGLAVAAERDGKTAVVFDLDPQATACFWADTREADTPAVKDCSVARLPHYLDAARDAGCALAIIDCPAVHRDIAHDAASHSDLASPSSSLRAEHHVVPAVMIAQTTGRPCSEAYFAPQPFGQSTNVVPAAVIAQTSCSEAYFAPQPFGQSTMWMCMSSPQW